MEKFIVHQPYLKNIEPTSTRGVVFLPPIGYILEGMKVALLTVIATNWYQLNRYGEPWRFYTDDNITSIKLKNEKI
jgi:hypothetical protein